MSENGDDSPEKQAPKSRKHFKDQFDEEDVLLVFRKHPIVMRKGLVLSAAGLVLGPIYTLILTTVHSDNPPTMGFFFASLGFSLILAVILLFPWWVRWYFSIYILTSHRLIQQTRSLLQINVVDISLEQIQMINYQIKGLEQTLLHFGTIIVQTYVGDLVIHEVHHPEKVQQKMVHILRQLGIHPSMRPGTTEEQKVIES